MNTNDAFFQYLKPLKASLNTKKFLISGIIAVLITIFKIGKYFYELDYKNIVSIFKNTELLNFLFYVNLTIFFIVCIWVIFRKKPKEIFYNITKLHNFKDFNNSQEVSLLNFVSKQKDLDVRYRRANDSTSEFIKWFKCIWLGWALLYIITFIFSLDPKFSSDHFALKSVLTNSANNLASLFFFICLLVLNEIAIKKGNEKFRVKIDLKWIFLILIISSLEIGLYFIFDKNPYLISKSFSIVSGLLAMISMSLLLGRLDSKLIDKLPISILVVLFGYAGIQLYLPLFLEQDSAISIDLISILYLALFCKIILLVFIYWIIDTNRLFFYFLAVYGIHNNINSEWKKIRDAFLSETKISEKEKNISGKWKVYEYYFSENNYGGFVKGEMVISYFNGEYNGTIELDDRPLHPSKNDTFFKVLQKLTVTRDKAEELFFKGSSPEILDKKNIKIDSKDYTPDEWYGKQIDDNTIIGFSKDNNNIQGNFYFERLITTPTKN